MKQSLTTMTALQRATLLGGYHSHFTPRPKPPRVSVGDKTTVEQWDGKRWVERVLVWDGYGFVTPDETPHASDCAVWVNESCNCTTGESRDRELERIQDGEL